MKKSAKQQILESWKSCPEDIVKFLFQFFPFELSASLQGHTDTIYCVLPLLDSLNNSRNINVVTGSNDKTLKIWDVQRRKCLNTLWELSEG